ncbi:type VI secretion system-associated FHA domain protein TagH [Erwinia sp. S63]|uniref:type VI secretion system-associated FHA domain protein TagH n=1 Tax=Erwinia sp. S63 TaxID=2769341 RepID=UPI00190D41AC|nr:type VI secretion system-associated FHA domain protein TagH [Erwinia sp. S63]MBK0098350.1 type VI secretion system-associated FHA domain protein TagH [Erwinia sp. S63]
MRFTLVESKNGVQPPLTSVDFYPPGGTIGRSEDNNFILPDDSRTISRLQLLVHTSAEGECRITNRGNVINVDFNGIPLEHGRQVELQSGDLLGIGDYTLEVSDIAGETPAPRVTASQATQAKPLVRHTESEVPGEIWESLSRDFSAPKVAPAAPEAHHPLTQPAAKALNPIDPLAQEDQHTELSQLGIRESDPARLFAENDLFQQPTILQDATPTTLRDQPQVAHQQPQTELDPLALFGSSGSAQPEDSDPFGLMNGQAQPLTPPDLFQPEAAPAIAAQHTPPAAAVAAPAPLAALTPSAPTATSPSASASASPLASASAAPIPTSPLSEISPPEPAPIPTPRVQQASPEHSNASRASGRMGIDPVSYKTAAQRRAANTPGVDADLLQAFLDGADLADIDAKPHLDQEQMHLLGQLLSLFSQGTVALLSSRTMLKRGVNAEMTMILEQANNPFKLLPSGKSVLVQMFSSQMPGFMEPEKAVRDALVDLQAHQLGMIAGIRAIITAMLQSFNPDNLQQEESGRHLFAASRKAARWDSFVKRYQTIASEIDDDFHTLFGEAFLHAYDVEVNHYKDLQTQKSDK